MDIKKGVISIQEHLKRTKKEKEKPKEDSTWVRSTWYANTPKETPKKEKGKNEYVGSKSTPLSAKINIDAEQLTAEQLKEIIVKQVIQRNLNPKKFLRDTEKQVTKEKKTIEQNREKHAKEAAQKQQIYNMPITRFKRLSQYAREYRLEELKKWNMNDLKEALEQAQGLKRAPAVNSKQFHEAKEDLLFTIQTKQALQS